MPIIKPISDLRNKTNHISDLVHKSHEPAAGIALWDVIAHCRREGSLDSAIRDEVVNDFGRFLGEHSRIGTVLFNGAKAETSFVRHVLPTLARSGLTCRRLPSTSPANASQTDAAKLAAWHAALLDAGARLATR